MRKIISLTLVSMIILTSVIASAPVSAKMQKDTTVSLSWRHSATIKNNGTLWTWGSNWYGELGNGTTTDSIVPIKIMDNVYAVSLGGYNSAAIKNDGTLWTWGCNTRGRLGNGTTIDSMTPIKIMDDVVAISLGDTHGAAIKADGTLWTWGQNEYGQLGNGTNTDSAIPIKIMDDVMGISLERYSSAAIKTDGSLWTWGWNIHGMLGNGTTTDSVVPIKIMDNVSEVDLGENHSAAIKNDGTLWTWGRGDYGSLGNGTRTDSATPIKIMDNVKTVRLGGLSSAAIKNDDTLWTWGENWHGQLGYETTASYSVVPIKIMDNVSVVSLGHSHGAAIKNDRTLWMWGGNSNGELGNGTKTDSLIPIKIMDDIMLPTDLGKEKTIKVILNGTELSFDQPPILDPAGRVLVPIRKIAEAMGDDVKWNQDIQTAFVEHKERALIIPLYTDHLYMAYSDKPVEWRKYDLDVPSQVQNGRTLTPVRAFCESLGATVNWDDSTQTVYIEYNGNYDYDSLSNETINGINMAYSIMREHNNISFEKYSEEIYAYLENSNSAVDNIAMSWGSGLFDGIVQLLSGEDATETAVKASLAQVISLLDNINRSDDNAEIINGIKFTKSGAEAVKAFSELPEENLRINNIDDLNKLSKTVPELESLSKAIKATGVAIDVLAFSAEQSTYLLADYAQNIAYLDNIEKYFMATSAGNDLLYKVIDDMREEYSSKWIHSLKSLRNEGLDKLLSMIADEATFGVFGIVNFAKDLTNELTGLSTSAKGLKEFYASCILNVAFDEAYYDMMEDVSGIHFHSDEMIDMFNMQRAVKATTYMSMNKIANSVDEVSWDDRIDELEDASYILWE